MFNCKGCVAKDKEIEYLRAMIDRLLLRESVVPVGSLQEDPEPEVTEISIDNDVDTYGGD